MKKIMTALLCALLALPFGGCALADVFNDMFNNNVDAVSKEIVRETEPFMQVVPDALSYSEGYTPVVSSYSYDALPLEGEKVLYNKLLEVYYDISAEKNEDADKYPMPQVETEGYPMSEAQVRCAMKAVYDDHPEIFWASGTIGFYADDSTTIVQVYSKYSPEEVDARVSAVRKAANEFYASVPDGLSAYERELTVHDYILSCTAYKQDIDTVEVGNNDPDIYTVYGALVNGEAVCEGYSRAFQMLLNGLGVDCVGISGKAEDVLHMWNAVRLGDQWYAVDATWDDHDEPYYRYSYFNLTSDAMAEDHVTSPLFSEIDEDEINGQTGTFNSDVMNMFVPVCEDATMNYYYRSSPWLSDYDAAQVKSDLLTAAENGEEYLVFYIDDALDYDTTVSELFAEYPQYFFTYVDIVNDYLPDYSIDTSNVAYVRLPKNRIVAVELHYY